jgi:mannose-6-phosphate isomerase, class I
MSTKKIFRLKGVVQYYNWGGSAFIPSLIGLENASHQPFAEYWLGAHDNASSTVMLSETESEPLNKLIQANAGLLLGHQVNDKFHRLPYLLKILDVKDMLSIQVHPNKKNAEADFARENLSGIPTDSPKRNYKDDNHKPELMVALSDFWLLHGFKNKKAVNETLNAVCELQPLAAIFTKAGYEGLYKYIMEMPQEEVNDILQPLLQRIITQYHQQSLEKSSADFWAARAALTFNSPGKIDRGIFSIYLFNLLFLKKGEAIFQAAGVPHAYLEGQNVEIMANSDNVLRGGLTPKHIDVKELMKHIVFKAVRPKIIQPAANDHRKIFNTPAADFELSLFEIRKKESIHHRAGTTEIVLVVDGELILKKNDTEILLSRGQSAVLVYGAAVAMKTATGTAFYLASVPIHNRE